MGTETPRPGIIIRAAQNRDVPAIYAIGAACFSDPWREETVRSDLAREGALYLVAEREDEVLGYACYWYVLDEAQLVNIGVMPRARRQGIAESLVRKGLVQAKAKGMTSMYLEVRVSNLPAQSLYRKFGFAVKALRKQVYEDPLEDGYIMAIGDL